MKAESDEGHQMARIFDRRYCGPGQLWAWITLGLYYIIDWAIIVDIYIYIYHIYVMILYALCVLMP